jgi:hypothetical protein
MTIFLFVCYLCYSCKGHFCINKKCLHLELAHCVYCTHFIWRLIIWWSKESNGHAVVKSQLLYVLGNNFIVLWRDNYSLYFTSLTLSRYVLKCSSCWEWRCHICDRRRTSRLLLSIGFFWSFWIRCYFPLQKIFEINKVIITHTGALVVLLLSLGH